MAEVFKFPVSRPGAVVMDETNIFKDESEEVEEPGIINGQQARSLLEWWAAKALWKLKRRFYYQYPLQGGSRRRGGILLDFLLIDGPPIVLEMQGERWHQGAFASGERLRESIIMSIVGVKPSYIWESDCPTEYDTYRMVRKALYG